MALEAVVAAALLLVEGMAAALPCRMVLLLMGTSLWVARRCMRSPWVMDAVILKVSPSRATELLLLRVCLTPDLITCTYQ